MSAGMLSFEEARGRLHSLARALPAERVAADECVGRVLAEDLRAPAPMPPFDYSAMDGYAVALEDLAGEGPFTLAVEGESRTGGELPGALGRGTACRIFTGARLPPRADAVVMQEDVEREGDRATFARKPRAGQHVRRAGEDLPAGALALARGTRLRATHAALIASLERARVNVARRPVVSVLSTGDELREPGEADRPGSVLDSNGPALAALVRACGGVPRRMPFARDEIHETRASLAAALDGADVVLTVGGVSVGEYDLVKPALESVGITLDFWRVAIKPGKPLAVGRAGDKYFLGLPGNPASAMLTFMLFGAPLLRALQGDAAPVPPLAAARLVEAVSHAPGRLEFARAELAYREGELRARVLPNQSSGAVGPTAWADGLVLLGPEVTRVEAGGAVSALWFDDV